MNILCELHEDGYWRAIDKDTYNGDIMGHGETREEAIEDLIMNYKDLFEGCASQERNDGILFYKISGEKIALLRHNHLNLYGTGTHTISTEAVEYLTELHAENEARRIAFINDQVKKRESECKKKFQDLGLI